MKAKAAKIDPTIRQKRYQVKQARLYNNWTVWTIGTEQILLAVYSAARHTRKNAAAAGENLLTQNLQYLAIMRLYLAETGRTYFQFLTVVRWAIDRGYLTKGHVLRQTQASQLAKLVNLHYINPLPDRPRCYTLTMRTRNLFRLFDGYMRDFIGDPPKKDQTFSS